MNTQIVLAVTVLTTTPAAAFGGSESICPSGLPAELFINCITASSAASSEENGPDHFGTEFYNVTEELQAWVDSQMRREIARENSEPAGADVARQLDEH
ncbi:MAG: hypothetical protein HY273_08925 [Gammaproteobacteria bacterium]|nr:hypothetical protein [Gammaproteobacteria bacterium]